MSDRHLPRGRSPSSYDQMTHRIIFHAAEAPCSDSVDRHLDRASLRGLSDPLRGDVKPTFSFCRPNPKPSRSPCIRSCAYRPSMSPVMWRQQGIDQKKTEVTRPTNLVKPLGYPGISQDESTHQLCDRRLQNGRPVVILCKRWDCSIQGKAGYFLTSFLQKDGSVQLEYGGELTRATFWTTCMSDSPFDQYPSSP